MKDNRKAMFYGGLGLLFLAISHMAHVSLPLIALSVFLLCKIIPLSAKINYLTFRIILSVVLLLTLFNIFGLVSHIVDIDIAAHVYVELSFIFIILSYIGQSSRGGVYPVGKFSRFDLIAAIPVLVGTGIFLVYMFGNGLSLSNNLVRFMGSSSDQSAHLSMFSDIMRNDGNYVYSSEELSINTPGINSYPMGWHQAMAVLSLNIFGTNAEVVPFIDVVKVYFACALFTFILYASAISLLTQFAYRKIFSISEKQGMQLGFSGAVLTSFGSLITIFLFLYISFSELGYINFMYASAIALICGLILIGVKRPSDLTVLTTSILATLLFAAVEAWYIVGLPLGLILLSVAIMYLKQNPIRSFPLRHILLLLGNGLLLSAALLVALRNIVGDGSSEQIMIGNAMAPWLPQTFVLLGVTILAIVIINKEKDNLLYIAVNSFFVSILLLTLLNFSQLQEYSYYQQKMMYAFFALCLPWAVLQAVRYLLEKKVNILLSISIICFSIYMVNPNGMINLTKNIMRPASDAEIGVIDKYFQTKFNDESPKIFIKDFRTSDERSTESYARLLLSKVVSPGDCYNQLIMPLLSLSSNSELPYDESSEVDAETAATRCYGGDVKFYILTNDKPPGLKPSGT